MPARDRYHNEVRSALVRDGWTITHDPLYLVWGNKDMYVDLGAEQILAAEKDAFKIAVEIKSFLGPSELHDLKEALGQYLLYHVVLGNSEKDRQLYMAIDEDTFRDLFEEPIGKLLIEHFHMRLVVFDPKSEEIRQWIPAPPAAS